MAASLADSTVIRATESIELARSAPRAVDAATPTLDLQQRHDDGISSPSNASFSLPTPARRCGFVIDRVMRHEANHSHKMLREKFRVQSKDVNSFYR